MVKVRSSSCKLVRLYVPEGWGELTQQQLQKMMQLLTLYADMDIAQAQVAALLYFNDMVVHRKQREGWLCEKDHKTFLLNPDFLPQIISRLDWLGQPEQMTDRIALMGDHKACDMWLRSLAFGEYLMLENFYQAFLSTHRPDLLERMTRVLYRVKEDEKVVIEPYFTMATFMWYACVKARFAKEFPNFLKPVADGVSTGCQADQKEMMTAQIRLLTKGDVTKNQQIMNVDVWSALTELDALAKEAQDFRNKMKKN